MMYHIGHQEVIEWPMLKILESVPEFTDSASDFGEHGGFHIGISDRLT
jgi:hypothetical protein